MRLSCGWRLLSNRLRAVRRTSSAERTGGCSRVADVTYSGAWTTRACGSCADRHCGPKEQSAARPDALMDTETHLPYYTSGEVVSGFGRGSKELGCPTANYPEKVVEALPKEFGTGVYYGWASLGKQVYKMVMNIGWNPFYHNDKKSMEVHIIHKFEKDFYGQELKIIILGYIRPEMNFSSIDELIQKINSDIEVAKKLLEEKNAIKYKEDPFLIN